MVECRCSSLYCVGLVCEAQDEGDHADQCRQPSPQASEPSKDRGVVLTIAQDIFPYRGYKEIAREKRNDECPHQRISVGRARHRGGDQIASTQPGHGHENTRAQSPHVFYERARHSSFWRAIRPSYFVRHRLPNLLLLDYREFPIPIVTPTIWVTV